jgi:hypothetical protein
MLIAKEGIWEEQTLRTSNNGTNRAADFEKFQNIPTYHEPN